MKRIMVHIVNILRINFLLALTLEKNNIDENGVLVVDVVPCALFTPNSLPSLYLHTLKPLYLWLVF